MQAGLRVVAAVSLGLVLAGCSRAADERTAAPVEPAAVAPAPAPAERAAVPAAASDAGATVGGDGSEIRLSSLSAAEIAGGKLAGELGCSFSTDAASPLLVAMGDVASKDRAYGLVKVGDYVEPMSAPGGFDGMLKGATFAGKGKTVRIEVTGSAAGGGESPARPATLTYDRADGAKRTFAGRWECGP
jgi:hypothetical protein